LAADVPIELSLLNAKQRLKSRRSFSTTSCDEHLLLVCAANLDRALKRASRRLRSSLEVTQETRRALWLLRNVYEHWDEIRGPLRAGRDDAKETLKKLRDEFPQADPWSFTVDPEYNIILSDVVDLNALIVELRRLEARVLKLERARARGSANVRTELAR
jgi:hypothetical protein